MATEYEYTRFGEGFQRRVAGSTDDWAECPLDDVPAGFFDDEVKRQARYLGLRDVDLDIPEGGSLVGGKNGPQTQMVAVRHANPEVDEIAGELGLTGDELRARLNGATGGTRLRVDEARFDAIAERLGLDPEEARSRFRE